MCVHVFPWAHMRTMCKRNFIWSVSARARSVYHLSRCIADEKREICCSMWFLCFRSFLIEFWPCIDEHLFSCWRVKRFGVFLFCILSLVSFVFNVFFSIVFNSIVPLDASCAHPSNYDTNRECTRRNRFISWNRKRKRRKEKENVRKKIADFTAQRIFRLNELRFSVFFSLFCWMWKTNLSNEIEIYIMIAKGCNTIVTSIYSLSCRLS